VTWSATAARDPVAEGWAGHSETLARFARATLFVRTDVFGEFGPGKRGVTHKGAVTEELLAAHYRGSRSLGAHTTSLANESFFGALDLDEDGNPQNEAVALQLMQRFRDLGLAVLLEESRARRYHLWIRFEVPAATAAVYTLLKRLAREAVALGIREPETFPKQAMLVSANGDGPFGNWLRLPGRHPETGTWSRIFDPETDTWLEGADAAMAILEWPASSPSTLPALTESPPSTTHGPAPTITVTADPNSETAIPQGHRNDTLTSLGGSMRRVGFSADAINAALLKTNQERCRPPLGTMDVDRIARSVGRYEPAIQLQEARSDHPRSNKPGVEPVRFLDLHNYAEQGIPEVEWLAEGWIARRDIILFAGSGGIGKSTTLGCWGYTMSLGSDFCGITTAGPLRVLYVDEEMGELDTARLVLRFGPLSSNLYVTSCQGIRLDTPAGVERLGNTIADCKAELVIGDSVQQLFGAADENSAQEIGAIYGSLFRIRDSLNVTFGLAHHKRKDAAGQRTEKIELVRGSTAHSTQPSCVVYVSPGEGGRLHLVQVKRRGAPKLSLCVRYEEGEDGSILLSGEGEVDADLLEVEKAKEWVLDYLTGRGEQQTKEIKAAAMAASVPWRTAQRALSDLVGSQELERPKHGHYRVCAKGPESEVL
jgi:hypothetical protein